MKRWKQWFTDELTTKLKKLWSYLSVWRELSSMAVGLLLWIQSAVFLRWIDPTAGTYDAGIFQIYLFAIIGLFILHGVVRILMKLIWPTSDDYLDHEFRKDFKTITPWQKLKLSTFIFFAFLFAVALLARTI
ncbi:hypothetical protein J8281_03590 [Aquimarina sp. U1-2]|uniref:hypothetical protein n=1 Tax=Aquimarina sp. U1-2 TaxID=2823141 RepID=UPI001AEC8E06|nr:hypothetical protein [Aquimarina sp. U1-2]MBP2831261.1 hypothetical protein [Aquimarina sp. U1-2]